MRTNVTTNRRNIGGNIVRNSFFVSCSVSALTLAIATATAQAQSQAQSQNQNAETVTVTGARAALGSALDIKQSSGQIVDSIVAEDIGKLPDSTVVESLQHVTGISIVRNSTQEAKTRSLL